ncbi:MAG: GDP-mannose 4,6-dehydratase [Candidatus Thorarchaeota archaeon]
MSMTAIVTGCAGFIGSNLVDALLKRGHRVIGVDNLRTGSLDNLAQAQRSGRFTLVQEDICSSKLTCLLTHDADVLFHLAAISSVPESIERPIDVNEVNLGGTLNVLELARKMDVKRFVFSSSAAVYGNVDHLPVLEEDALRPLSPYAASKVAAETYVRVFQETYGVDTTILRYFNVYGPRQNTTGYGGVVAVFISQALANEPVTVHGEGKQRRSLIYVDDVVRATILAGEVPGASGQTINVSAPESVSIVELAEMVLRNVNGTRSQIVHFPRRIADIDDSYGSIERARTVLGFLPSVPLEEGLRETIRWYSSRGEFPMH